MLFSTGGVSGSIRLKLSNVIFQTSFSLSKIALQPGDQSIVVGDYNGEIHLFNLHNGNEIHMFSAHDSYIIHVEPNRTGEFLLSSSTWGKPVSALWNMKSYEMKYDQQFLDLFKGILMLYFLEYHSTMKSM